MVEGRGESAFPATLRGAEPSINCCESGALQTINRLPNVSKFIHPPSLPAMKWFRWHSNTVACSRRDLLEVSSNARLNPKPASRATATVAQMDSPLDLSFLPSDVVQAARIERDGEVAWPLADATSAINALAAAGRLVLGLDARR